MFVVYIMVVSVESVESEKGNTKNALKETTETAARGTVAGLLGPVSWMGSKMGLHADKADKELQEQQMTKGEYLKQVVAQAEGDTLKANFQLFKNEISQKKKNGEFGNA